MGGNVGGLRVGSIAIFAATIMMLLAPTSSAASQESPHPATQFAVQAVAAPASEQASVSGLRSAISPRVVPTAPFTECPAVGHDTSCELLIDVTASGTIVYQDPSVGPFDGSDDTLIGVINQSSTTVGHLALSSNTGLFGFDGDGICSGGYANAPGGCPFGTTGYEGPKTSFSNITSNASGGDVNFTGGLAPGATSYFSLEEALNSSTVITGGPGPAEQGGPINLAERSTTCPVADPVNCATGTFWHSFTDINVPGNGVALNLTRTYSAAQAATDGPFGFGWTDSYNMHLSTDAATGAVTIVQEDGAEVTFFPNGTGGFTAPPRVLASLVTSSGGTYTFTRDSDQVRDVFDASSGELLRQVDRNGYTTTLSYSGNQLTSVTDPSGRKLTFTYSGSHVASATDPAGNSYSYSYDATGNLVSTTDALGRTWSFTYDRSHLLLTMTDPRGGTTTNTYNSSAQVVKQVDSAGRSTTLVYTGDNSSPAGGATDVTDPRGLVTRYSYANLELGAITRDYGGTEAATTIYQYDPATLGVTSGTDPDGNVTTSTYDSAGNLASTKDPTGGTTRYTYNAFDEPTSKTDPAGTTTTYGYDANGNLLSTSTPLSGGGASTATYTYGTGASAGEVLTSTNPNGKTTSYGYDGAGDRTSSTDPLGHRTTKSYDVDGRVTSQTTPAGDTTSYTYDADGELAKTVDPLGKVTSYSYDGDGNQTAVTDPNGHTTRYSYDADNEQSKVTRPNGDTSTTTYDGDGNVLAQTDGNAHTTTYTYDSLNRVASTIDADGHKTTDTYDGDGNLLTSVDPSGRTTTYTYDADSRVTSIHYSDGTTSSVTEGYDAHGRRTSLKDGTGSSIFSYDTLGDLTSETNGAGAVVDYGYDPAGNVTSITYPNGKTVTRSYDADGQLASVTDWLGNKTSFSHDGDGNLSAQDLPGGVSAKSSYDSADRLIGINDSKGAANLGSFTYRRDSIGQVTGGAITGAVSDSNGYSYDADNRLTSFNGTSYGYDAGDNPTTYGGGTQTFDPADELLTSSAGTSSGGGSAGGGSGTGAAGGGSGSGAGTNPGGSGPTSGSGPVPVVGVSQTSKVGSGGLLETSVSTKQAGDLLIAFVSAAGPQKPDQSVTPVSSRGVKWSPVTQAHSSGGLVAIWEARSPHKVAHLQVSTRLRQPSSEALLTVVAFTPSASLGRHASGAGTHGAAVLKLRTVGSAALWTVGHDARNGNAPTPLSGNHLVKQELSAKHQNSSWLQQSVVTKAGVHTVGERGPTSTSWALATIAVQPRTKAADVLLADDSSNRTFAYDAEGDRTSVTHGGSAVKLGYDQASRLVSVSGGISYTYDGDSLRMSKTVSGTTTRFTWDESGNLPLLLQSGSTYYIYGEGGQPIEQVTGSTPYYLLADQQGSTRLLTNGGGSVVGTYSYDPWGNVTSHTGTATTALQYDAEYTDAETGYEYLRSRYYDPSTGQFLSVDPVDAVTGEPFVYGANSPVDDKDPSGLYATAACDDVDGSVAFGVDVSGSAEVCDWTGGSGLDPFQWYAVTVTVGDSIGVGLEVGATVEVGGEVNFSASSPKDLAGRSCDVSGGAKAFGAVDVNAACDLESIGFSVGGGPAAGAHGSVGASQTYVIKSSDEFSDPPPSFGGTSIGTGCGTGQLLTGTIDPQSGADLVPAGGRLTVVP